jgi:Raf kinase inhibitor-like YbhB/YbcL family protein
MNHRACAYRVVALVGGFAATAVVASSPAWAQGKLRLESATFADGATLKSEQVYSSFGCTGDNVSPELHWSGAPEGTKSFAITVYDPDAPTGSGWWHWLVFNIPATVTSLPAGAGDGSSGKLPKGSVQSRTDFGKPGYGGPCPPPGKRHHYIFTIYALKVPSLPLAPETSAAMVSFNLHANSLASAKVTGLYGR